MIGYLKGKVIDKSLGYVVLDVNGVGYRVQLSAIDYQLLDEVELWIHTYVREDQLSLYGFEYKTQLKMFELLISVSGVGPKVGMSILSQAKVDDIQQAVAKADVKFFTSIKGLGKKGSQKIIIELKNKLGSVEELDLDDNSKGDDVFEGLVAMGFEGRKVKEVLKELPEELSESAKIKQVIKKLSA